MMQSVNNHTLANHPCATATDGVRVHEARKPVAPSSSYVACPHVVRARRIHGISFMLCTMRFDMHRQHMQEGAPAP